MHLFRIIILLACFLNFTIHAAFVLSSSPQVGNRPISIATTSVSNQVDLVVANGNALTLSILTNNGFGVFGSNATLIAAGVPTSVVSGHIHNTNSMDIVCANYGSNTVSVFTNNGVGVFQLCSVVPVGNQPNCLALADVNGDTKLDLICANGGDNTVTVMTNDGFGNLLQSGVYAVGNDPVCVTTADINGDGWPDIITANETSNSISVLLNDGTGNFILPAATYGVTRYPTSLAAFDLNGDGWPDVVTANVGTNTLTVYTNDGFGNLVFMTNYVVGNNPVSVVATGSGVGASLACVIRTNTLVILTNNLAGVFTISTNMAVGRRPNYVLAADVNGDGNADLIVANSGTNTISVLTNSTPYLGPIANPDSASSPKSLAVTINVLANDSDPRGYPLAIASVSPTNGTAAISGATVIFTPTTNFIGLALIGYSITNTVGQSNSTLVSITYTDRPPVAVNAFVMTSTNTITTNNVLAADSDPDGDLLTITSVMPTNCTASISGSNIIATTSGSNSNAFVGYSITDGFGLTNSAVLTLLVASPLIPTMTSSSAPSGLVTAGGPCVTNTGYLAMDGNTTTYWSLFTAYGGATNQMQYTNVSAWVQYQFPSAKTATSCLFTFSTSFSSPSYFVQLDGSNDGINWTVISSSGITGSGFGPYVLTLINSTAYTYYRFYDASGANDGVTVFQLYGY